MNRREFFRSILLMSTSLILPKSYGFFPFEEQKKPLPEDSDGDASDRRIFSRIIQQALQNGWTSLPIGECMGKIALLFIDTDYVGGTIEGEGPEVCRVDLAGLDCVTLCENALCLARVLKMGKNSYEDFIAELTFTRYRKGILTDYTSRLHYTSDWIHDNEKKRVLSNITRDLGGIDFPVRVSFMSKNPGHYPALREFPEFVATIASIEAEINQRQHWFIPKKKVKRIQKHLRTGDIIAVATQKKGLDYAHVGMAFRDERGKLRFLHASSAKKKVLLDAEIHEYIRSVETYTGITIARPLEPRCEISTFPE